MRISHTSIYYFAMSAAFGLIGLWGRPASAGCPCQGHHRAPNHVGQFDIHSAPDSHGGRYRAEYGRFDQQPTWMPTRSAPPRGMIPQTEFDPAPPPAGTLGSTYKRFSTPVPDDKHPRAAMLDLKGVPPDAEASVKGMEGFRDDNGVWHFETERPLVPGVPHIYRLAARMRRDGQRLTEVRTLRLIPGRIVDLDFY